MSHNNPNGEAGTRFASEVAAFLKDHGQPRAERRAQYGSKDRGDIIGVDDWALEAKATRTIDLAGAVDEATKEAQNADVRWGAAVIKRRNKGTGDAYVVMTLRQFAALLSVEGADAQ